MRPWRQPPVQVGDQVAECLVVHLAGPELVLDRRRHLRHLHEVHSTFVGRELVQFGDASAGDVEDGPGVVLAGVQHHVPAAQPRDGPRVPARFGLGDVAAVGAVDHPSTLPEACPPPASSGALSTGFTRLSAPRARMDPARPDLGDRVQGYRAGDGRRPRRPRRHCARRARAARRRHAGRARRRRDRPHRGARPAAQRRDPPPVRAGPAATRPRPRPTAPFAGVPFLFKDLGCEEAGEPHHQGMRALRDAGWRATADSELARAVPRRRPDPARPDQRARARPDGDDRAGRLRPDPQPVGPRPLAGRLVRRVGGRRRRRAGPGRPRQRHRRLDPHPGRPVRPGRAEAEHGAGSSRAERATPPSG